MPLNVGVAGALGRLGRVAVAALAAEADIEVVAAFGRTGVGDALAEHVPGFRGKARIFGELSAFYAVGMDVVVDCTVQPTSRAVAREALEAEVSPVVGSSGWGADDLAELAAQAGERGIGAMLVPNFSVGAVLMMRFAAEAARFMPRMEIIELHHEGKRDAPSGTARLTAQRIAQAGGPNEVTIHSVRLPGLVAHQEVIFGGFGETLTLRHDSLARESFGPGIVLAVRNVRRKPGLTVGLDAVLFAEAAS